jgi:hypothetical protein
MVGGSHRVLRLPPPLKRVADEIDDLHQQFVKKYFE